MKKITKILYALIIFSLSIDALNAASIDSQIKTQQNKKRDIDKKIQKYNAIAKTKAQESQTLLGQLSRLRQDANNSQAKITDLERENKKLQNSVSTLQKNINVINNSVNDIKKTLGNRVLEIYKHGNEEHHFNLILSSEGPHDALNTNYLLGRLARQDELMINNLEHKEKELLNAKSKLEENKKQVQTQTDDLKKKRAEYNTAIKKTDALLKNVRSEEKQAQSAAKELQSAQKAIGNKINSLLKQKNSVQISSVKKVSQSQSKSKNKNSNSTLRRNIPVSSQYSGKFSWPVNGVIYHQYGTYVHPTFRTKIFNSGIDIRASVGTSVKAAAPGEVLYSGWIKGYGQVIMIEHGGNIVTVYGHLGSVTVREGSRVNAGSIIGTVGNSGTDSEYGLHFEIRKNGDSQNPLNYLRK